MTRLPLVGIILVLLVPKMGVADSAVPFETKTYTSPNGQFALTVDPGYQSDRTWTMNPVLTLEEEGQGVLWVRTAEDFESFRFPPHACVSDDGKWIVFGGYGAHNFKNYEEGLRFYSEDGALIAFVSRLDLPAGQLSVSTAHWYDNKRSRISGQAFYLFTPGRTEPTSFDLPTGAPIDGPLTEGAGDDVEALKRRIKKAETNDA